MSNSKAPICLFTYNRLIETKETVEALRDNSLAPESEIFIFSDGPKSDLDYTNVSNVRKYLQSISGFKSVNLFESKENKGLASSIITGVSTILKTYKRTIVLEDDLITSNNFLLFMNHALAFFENTEKIFSISGYTMDLPSLKDYDKDYYLAYRASSWGWGTWRNRWESVNWKVNNQTNFFKNPLQHVRFMRGGSDMPRMLKKQLNNDIDSWAILWCYNQFLQEKLTVFPSVSKVKSIGFGDKATHTKLSNRFVTRLDTGNTKCFSFDKNLQINKQLIQEFRKKFSVKNRFFDKFINALSQFR